MSDERDEGTRAMRGVMFGTWSGVMAWIAAGLLFAWICGWI